MHELYQIVWSSDSLASRSTALPTPKRLGPGPSTCRCSTFSVRVCDSEVDAPEELVNLALVVAEDPSRQAEIRVVSLLQCLIQALDLVNNDEGKKEFLLEEPIIGRQARDNSWFDIVALGEFLAFWKPASGDYLAAAFFCEFEIALE